MNTVITTEKGIVTVRVFNKKGRCMKAATYHEDCVYCMNQYNANNFFFPSHDAGKRCESGKRDHCTCDSCF